MQDDNDRLLMDGLNVPAGQAVHDDSSALPVNGLYVPDRQAVQDV